MFQSDLIPAIHTLASESHVIFTIYSIVDGSETQIYLIGEKRISVHNCFYVSAVYVDSEVELEFYFK